MTALTLRAMKADITRDSPPLPEWKWQTKEGLKLAPADMKTSHIYSTLCMLWHHTMPTEAQLHPHKRYRLGPRFTEGYTRIAVRILMTELLARAPLPDLYMAKLQQMFAYLHRNQAQLARGPLRISYHGLDPIS